MNISLTLGTTTLEALRSELRGRGVRQNAYAEALFERVVVESVPREITLKITSFAELGLESGGTIEELARCASSRGLEFAPLEAAIRFRLLWKEDVQGERVTVISPRVVVEETFPRGFYLRCDDEGVWLRGYVASDDWRFEGSERIAMVVG